MLCPSASSSPIEVKPPIPLDRCTMCGIYRALSTFIDRPWNEPYCVDRYACFRRGALMQPPAKPEIESFNVSWAIPALEFAIAKQTGMAI